jgi:hypothetical protein
MIDPERLEAACASFGAVITPAVVNVTAIKLAAITSLKILAMVLNSIVYSLD